MLFSIKEKAPTIERQKIQSIDKSIDNKIILNQIKGTNPKYAKHMLLKNDIVRKFALDVFGGIEILEQPVCRKCERPGTWHTDGAGFCMVCGTTTQKPITVREYYVQELKATDAELEQMERHLNRGGVELDGEIIK